VTMECRDARGLADPFLSEQLLVETTHEIVQHLERCPGCRAEFDAQRRLRALTRSAFERAPELRMRPEFLETLRARLHAESAAPQRAKVWRGWLAVAAMAALIAGMGGAQQWSAIQRLAALAHLAAGDHQDCALKFKLFEDPITLEEAGRRYGGAFEALQSVEPATTPLRAGPLRILERHACVFKGRRFAHIVLEYRKAAVSVLVADDDEVGPYWWRGATARQIPPAGGFQVSSFRSRQHVVFVVSSLPGADVDDVARAIAGPVSRALAGA